ncbi:MAG: hypothetical protein IJQ67_02995 [Bacilli bacterium]|nr:hypothetical protein [Bacilli bacterium]
MALVVLIQTWLIILVAVVGSIFLIALFILLYVIVFSRNAAKRTVKDLEKKYSYLDALLIGQDSQYIHRLEIVSRTNLLYVDIYNEFSRRFKSIYEIDDKFAESKIKQVKTLIANKQYKNIKLVIENVKNAVQILEDKVNELDRDLYDVIKPEEEARQAILRLKESYRAVKQLFFSLSSDLELILPSFNKAFDKLDETFAKFETHIDSAEYDEANALLPVISGVVAALKQALEQMPNFCIYVTKILPQKIEEITEKYNTLEANGYPLFHLSFRSKVDDWNYRLSAIKKQLIALHVAGIGEECETIQNEIDALSLELDKEVEDKEYFVLNNSEIYKNVLDLEKSFLKICSILPEVEQVYIVEELQQEQMKILKENINSMGVSKRSLDAFVHSSTPQPYSVLRSKLEQLHADYDVAYVGLNNFRSYLESLKTSSEEAYNMIFVYYYRLREAEFTLSMINLPEFAKTYDERINECYELLNEIDRTIKIRPIDVALINQKVEELKVKASILLDDIDCKERECKLAESAIVYANRDRVHQEEVHQYLTALEEKFYEGQFETVYHEADSLFRRSHVETNNG